MIRNFFIFIGTFVTGALIALVVRAARFQPHAESEGHPPTADYAPMVSNVLAPAPARAAPDAGPAKTAPTEPHPGHPAATAAPGKAVNSICAICSMAVDPRLPTLEYQGKTIGFGCRMCPPKFKADPDRYGPYYLGNQRLPK
jgi:hypothetical protein